MAHSVARPTTQDAAHDLARDIEHRKHRHNYPVADGLHPLVYKTLVGLALWLILSVWVFFNRGKYMDITLVVISGFILMAMAIPLTLWTTWRHARGRDEPNAPALHDWLASEFATWQGRMSGREAATQILLPIAAVCIGMTVFGIVFALTVPAASY